MLRVITAYQCWDPPTHTTGKAAAACVELGPKAVPILPGPLRNCRLGSALLRYWGSLDCKMGSEVLRNSGTSWMCYVNGQATLACIPLLRSAAEDLRISKLVEEEPWRSLASIFSCADKETEVKRHFWDPTAHQQLAGLDPSSAELMLQVVSSPLLFLRSSVQMFEIIPKWCCTFSAEVSMWSPVGYAWHA